MKHRYLYRGVNHKIYHKTNGELWPKAPGEPFKKPLYYGQGHHYGEGYYGNCEENAVILHQKDSSRWRTSGISTTPSLENAKIYAAHDGKYSSGFVYKIDRHLLGQFGVKWYEVSKNTTAPAIPGDQEIILVAENYGPLPKEIVVGIEEVKA